MKKISPCLLLVLFAAAAYASSRGAVVVTDVGGGVAALSDPENQCVYTVYVRTGSIWKGGTDSKIGVTLLGADGTGIRIADLEQWGGLMADGHDYFERGNLDIFSGRGPCMRRAPCWANVTSAAAAASGEFRRAKKRSAPTDPLGAKNSGVDARAHKDKLELKAVKDGSASYAALEKKAELYEKLSRGELPDEEDKEKYCVDFFQKGFDRVYEPQLPENHRATYASEPENNHEDSMPNAKPMGLGQAGTTIDRDEHKRFVREVHEEVSEARQKASTMRSRRQEQDAARREKLRQAYLKKKLEKLIAEKQASSTADDLPAS